VIQVIKVARDDRSLRLGQLLAAGVIDSTGLAFGWTIILLVVADRGGLSAGALMSAAMLVGIALSAPVGATLSARLSARDLLRILAVAEGACRLGIFLFLWFRVDAHLMALLVIVMNALAWSAFAAMRAEVARSVSAQSEQENGRSLTWYAVAIASSEALAAGAAALLLDRTPSPAVLAVVTTGYVLSLLPQWWVGSHADPDRPRRSAGLPPLRPTIAPAGLGAVVFLLAGAPALLATVLAYELHGSTGVVVSALAFTACSLGATRLQSHLGRWSPPALPLLALGALLVGGWSLSGQGLIGLAFAQGCAGLAQCTLEGELDSRIVSRVPAGAATAGLAFASSSRALGGALAVALLPVMLRHAALPTLTAGLAGILALAAVGLGLGHLLHPVRHLPPSFAVGFAAGVVTGAVTDAAVRVRETAGVSRPSMPVRGRR
jgi:hypothetical protein